MPMLFSTALRTTPNKTVSLSPASRSPVYLRSKWFIVLAEDRIDEISPSLQSVS